MMQPKIFLLFLSLLFVLNYSVVYATPTLRSSSTADQSSGVSATSGLLSNVQSGDMLTVVLRERDGSSPVSISDTVNGSWNLNNSVVSNSFSGVTNSRIYYFPNSQAGNPTVTVTFGGSTMFSFYVDAWGGVSLSNPLYTSNTNINPVGTLHSHGSVTTSGESLIITALGSGSGSTGTVTASSGFNMSNTVTRNIRQYKISSASETTTGSITTGSSIGTNGAIAVFSPLGSSPSPSPTPPPPSPTPSPTPTPRPTGSKTLYVNANTGNDGVTYINNSQSTPWRTIGRAAWGSTNRSTPNSSEAAGPGDIVIVESGIYSVASTNNRWDVAYNPVNSGISGNPITFRANGFVDLRSTGGTGPLIGCYSRPYIIWDGFYINEIYARPAPDTGLITVNASNNCVIQNSEVVGTYADYWDNHNGIRVEGSNFTIIRNNKLHGFGFDRGGDLDGVVTIPSRNQNSAAVMLYDSNDTIIENNEMYDSGAGVFIKGLHDGSTQRRNIIRYNYIHDMTDGVGGTTDTTFCVELLASYDDQVYQNICKGMDYYGIRIFDLGGGSGIQPINPIIVNNTFYQVGRFSSSGAIYFHGSAVNGIFQNNIVYNSIPDAITGDFSTQVNGTSFDRNIYFGFTNFANFPDGVRSTFSQWQAAGRDVNGLNSNPLFINANSGNFRLQTGSPALTLGRVVAGIGGSTGSVIPAGAYITGNEVIGINTGAIPPTPSPTPSAMAVLGDLNVDHVVNSLDWSIMNSQWFTGNSQSDLRVDGQVNSLDFAILSSNWGRTW